MSQDAQKKAAAEAALKYVEEDATIGVGTGSTVNFFIDALAARRARIKTTVASSEASAKRLRDLRIPVSELNDTDGCDVYVDGADEITEHLAMTKGGGGALTREKIVASASRRIVCIADAGKLVGVLGKFPLPVEVIPMARSLVGRRLVKLGGMPQLRAGFTTDNGNLILDVRGLSYETHAAQAHRPRAAWSRTGSSPRPAYVLVLGTDQGGRTIERPK
jgi:ribose 5-phosphate isomerase A